MFGGCDILLSLVVIYFGSLHQGLSFQMTIGPINFYCLYNFMVPCTNGHLGFMLIYKYLLFCSLWFCYVNAISYLLLLFTCNVVW
jgi:hypothetical protein